MLLRYQYYRSKHVLYQEVMPVVGGDNPSSATRPILGHLPSAQETRDEIAKAALHQLLSCLLLPTTGAGSHIQEDYVVRSDFTI